MQHISQDINRRAKEVKQERVLRAGAQPQCRYCVDVALRRAHTVHLNSHNPKTFTSRVWTRSKPRVSRFNTHFTSLLLL